MRITIKLDAFDRVSDAAYAVIWLDTSCGRWSREGHDRIELPAWGTWQSATDGTLLLDPATHAPLFLFRGMRLDAAEDSRNVIDSKKAEHGRVERFGIGPDGAALTKDSGHWHVQCVDREATIAEHEIFSDEPDAPHEHEEPGRDAET